MKVRTSDIEASGVRDATTFLRGDDTWAVPAGGGGGGGSAWTLIDSIVISSPTTFTEFNLTGYNEIMAVALRITTTVGSRRSFQVSTDGGSTWLTGGSDYTFYSATGAATTASLILGHDNDSNLARTTMLELDLAASRSFKLLNRNVNAGLVTGATATINRLRFAASNTVSLGTTTMTGGTVSVWGR